MPRAPQEDDGGDERDQRGHHDAEHEYRRPTRVVLVRTRRDQLGD